MAKGLNYINGEWVAGDQFTENINPSDLSDVIGRYARATKEQTVCAITAAQSAAADWGHASAQLRAELLDKVGTEILKRRTELGRLLSREEGKPLADAIGEVERAGWIFKFFSGEALRTPGEKLPAIRSNTEVDIVREPLGPIGIITPWNFPIAIPAWKVAPALAFGNTVVLKSADLVPASANELAKIIHQVGFPQGVFNLVNGQGSVVGETILADERIQAVSFTGSVGVGRHVAATMVGRMAKVQLEMGGKNPLVVLNDADLDNAVDTAVQGAFYQTGQRCTASSRIIVQEGILPRFVAAFKEKTKSLVVGHALEPQTQIGPVASEAQLLQNEKYIQVGIDEGATLLCGGERLTKNTAGYFFSPAIFADCHNSMRICQEEIFGPIVSLIPVKTYEEALDIANDTRFGLSAGICTTSLKHAAHFKQHSKAGMVMVNCPTAGVDFHAPFGGRQASSYGPREQGRYAVEFYTTVKTTYTKYK